MNGQITKHWLGWSPKPIIRTLHEMTHGKVKADFKWGPAVAMTPRNIGIMRKVIEAHRKQLEKPGKLLSILDQWANGDFSRTVEYHNYFWLLEDGDTGKAQGLLSKRGQHDYAELHFPPQVRKHIIW